MGLTLKLNQKDVERITGKLKKIKENCSTSKGSPIAKFVVTLADQYGDAVQSVMGVVDETGGSATSTPFFGSSFSVGWIGLSEMTMKKKREAGMTLEIWKATGETQKAVASPSRKAWAEFHVPYREIRVFAGIDIKHDRAAFEKAMNNEYGWYDGVDGNNRALFTLANEVFRSQKDAILREVKRLMLDGVNWGAGR